jgi:hypothetical protein
MVLCISIEQSLAIAAEPTFKEIGKNLSDSTDKLPMNGHFH